MAKNENVLKGLAALYMTYSLEREKSTNDGVRLRAELWIELFRDMDDDIFSAAIKQHITSSKWFPTPADLFEIAKHWEDVADGGDDWAAAWSVVKQTIGRYGAWGTTEEVNRYIGEKLPAAMADDTRVVVQRFGWRELCNMDSDQESTWRAQFRDAYTRIRSSRVERHRMTDEVRDLIFGIAHKLAASRLSAPKEDK
jgi:hypothetical protein